jgi:hypothetical protein
MQQQTYTLKYILNNQFFVKNDLTIDQVNAIKRQKNIRITYEHQDTLFDQSFEKFVQAIKDREIIFKLS